MKQRDLLKTILQESAQREAETAIFLGDIFNLFIYKKVKRIAEALYLVTNHIKDNEPLKKTIRLASVDFLEMSVRLNNTEEFGPKEIFFGKMIFYVARLLSLLELATIAGLVNESNYILIGRELNLIFKSLSDKKANFENTENKSLSTSFFDVDIRNNGGIKLKNIKDKFLTDNKKFSERRSETVKIYKGHNLDIKKEDEESIKDTKNELKNKDEIGNILRTVEKLNKEKFIKDLFEKNENRKMTVKDIAVLLPQYSEKTIQRELSRFVSNKILYREGKKRWTVYFMNKG